MHSPDPLFDLPVERLDNPPMPWKQYRNMMFREWARKAAILGFVILIVTLILIPWGQQ